ncbi:MAG: hypothetical protein AB7I32_11205 [Gammaproteobacteria bacterium]
MKPIPAPDATHASRSSNRLILLLIFGVFVLPIAVAWLLASGTLGWRPGVLTNHGTLIAPPVDFATLPTTEPAAPLRALPPADWALLYVSEGACDDACRTVLRELAAMPMVIGKNGTRLHVFGLFATAPAQTEARALVDPALVRAIGDRLRGGEQKLDLPFIGFLDWRGQLMMHFAPSTPPDEVKGDLKRLLTASAIK